MGSGSYADVTIDGDLAGSTPIYRRPIDAGDHEVVLVDPASHQVRLRQTVQVKPGELAKVIAR